MLFSVDPVEEANSSSATVCPVCFKSFNEDCNQPRILLCGHTFCNHCMTSIANKCPLCKATFTRAQHSKNFALMQLIEEVQRKDLPQCSWHKKPFRLLCNTCDELVCLECLNTEHDEHTFKKLGNRPMKLIKEIETYVKTLMDNPSLDEDYLARIESLTERWTDLIKVGVSEEISRVKRLVSEARSMIEQIGEKIEIKIKRYEVQFLKLLSKLYSFETLPQAKKTSLELFNDLKRIQFSEENPEFPLIEERVRQLQKGFEESRIVLENKLGFNIIDDYLKKKNSKRPSKLEIAKEATSGLKKLTNDEVLLGKRDENFITTDLGKIEQFVNDLKMLTSTTLILN